PEGGQHPRREVPAAPGRRRRIAAGPPCASPPGQYDPQPLCLPACRVQRLVCPVSVAEPTRGAGGGRACPGWLAGATGPATSGRAAFLVPPGRRRSIASVRREG